MSYASFLYLGLFLGAVYLVWAALPAAKRPFALLAGSLVFYWINAGRYILWILAAALAAWLAGALLGRIDTLAAQGAAGLAGPEKKAYRKQAAATKKAVVGVACALVLGVYITLKYGLFAAEQVNALLSLLPTAPALGLPAWVAPLGLSFYALMAAGYLIDVYRGTCKPAAHYWQVLLFLSFWPHVVEGPFDRYGALEPTLLGAAQRPDYHNLTFGTQRILWGMMKKSIIADRANMLVVSVFGNQQTYTGSAVVLGVLLYTLQIYAEFSGAMDMALGSAELFGIPLAENFRQPFFARSVSEFWRRWHITLGAWLREYLFQPLIVSKPFIRLGKKCREKLGPAAGRNLPVWLGLLVTWLAIGAWHQAGWLYILYGLYYCALQLLGEWFEPLWIKWLPGLPRWRKTGAWRVWQILRTGVLVCFGMMIFRALGGRALLAMLRALAIPYTGSFAIRLTARDLILLAVGAAVIFAVDFVHERGVRIRTALAARPLVLRWGVYLAAILVLVVFGAYGDNYEPVGFIYAQF